MSRPWGYREEVGPGSLGVYGKGATVTGLYLRSYVSAVMEENLGKDFYVTLISLSNSENNREEGRGAENYAEHNICITNSSRARLCHWALPEGHLRTEGGETCPIAYDSDLGR